MRVCESEEECSAIDLMLAEARYQSCALGPNKKMQNTQILNQDGMSLKYNLEIKHVLTDAHCALHRFTSYKVSAGAKFVGESSLNNFCISSYS